MASEQFSLCWDNFHKNMSSGMNALLENEDLVDVTLAVEGKCLKAHKMVLSVCSPYFKELFKSNPCQHPIVFMKDVSYVALSDLLQFMYQGEVQVSQENLTTFIKTAEALQIKGLTGDGNGSTDPDISETSQEKPVHQIEEYKPIARPKKQLTPVVASVPVKRSRLSTSSFESPVMSNVAKSEPLASTASSAEQPVKFKMEPYDQSQSLMDDSVDETFADDPLDDTNVDETEEYSMMEGGGGEDEPQAGTSTDGAGEGQGTLGHIWIGAGTKNPKIILDCNEFTINTKQGDRTRWRCTQYFKSKCRASLVTYGRVVKVNKFHNHPNVNPSNANLLVQPVRIVRNRNFFIN